MVEHRYKFNDAPGAFGGFEWSGDTTDLIHVPGWFSDYVESVQLEENDGIQILYFETIDGRNLVATTGDIVLFRLGKLIVCPPDICKFFLKELM